VIELLTIIPRHEQLEQGAVDRRDVLSDVMPLDLRGGAEVIIDENRVLCVGPWRDPVHAVRCRALQRRAVEG
jgi:hypothetical protein